MDAALTLLKTQLLEQLINDVLASWHQGHLHSPRILTPSIMLVSKAWYNIAARINKSTVCLVATNTLTYYTLALVPRCQSLAPHPDSGKTARIRLTEETWGPDDQKVPWFVPLGSSPLVRGHRLPLRDLRIGHLALHVDAGARETQMWAILEGAGLIQELTLTGGRPLAPDQPLALDILPLHEAFRGLVKVTIGSAILQYFRFSAAMKRNRLESWLGSRDHKAQSSITADMQLRVLCPDADVVPQESRWHMRMDHAHILDARLTPALKRLVVIIDDIKHSTDVNESLQALQSRRPHVEIMHVRPHTATTVADDEHRDQHAQA